MIVGMRCDCRGMWITSCLWWDARWRGSNTSYQEPDEDKSIDVTIGVFLMVPATTNSILNTDYWMGKDMGRQSTVVLWEEETENSDRYKKWDIRGMLTRDIEEVINDKVIIKSRGESYENDFWQA